MRNVSYAHLAQISSSRQVLLAPLTMSFITIYILSSFFLAARAQDDINQVSNLYFIEGKQEHQFSREEVSLREAF